MIKIKNPVVKSEIIGRSNNYNTSEGENEILQNFYNSNITSTLLYTNDIIIFHILILLTYMDI